MERLYDMFSYDNLENIDYIIDNHKDVIIPDKDLEQIRLAMYSIFDEIYIANIESLICLKCKAVIDMITRKQNGDDIDSKQIAKHKKDVFRLAGMLAPSDKYNIPATLKRDIADFCAATEADLPNKDFLKAAGLNHVTGNDLISQLKSTFILG